MKQITEKRLKKAMKRQSKRKERNEYWKKIAYDNWKYADEHPAPWKPVMVDASGSTLEDVMAKFIDLEVKS